MVMGNMVRRLPFPRAQQQRGSTIRDPGMLHLGTMQDEVDEYLLCLF